MNESSPDTQAALLSNLASLGDRLLGQIIDGTIALAIMGASAVLFFVSVMAGAAALIAGVVVAILYIWLSDGLENGQSYGKRVVKTAVVDATTGAPCGFGQSFLRNFLSSILGIIDWVFIFGRKRQRLGDMAANTLVIKAAGN